MGLNKPTLSNLEYKEIIKEELIHSYNYQLYNILESKLDISFSNHFTLLISRLCDKQCPHCICDSSDKFKQDFNKYKLIKIVDELGKKGIKQVTITGGEPMIYIDDLPDIFYHIGLNKIIIKSIKTNMIFADKKNYKHKINKIFNKYKQGLIDVGVPEEQTQTYVKLGLEPSIDRFHDGIAPNLGKLKQIIDLNMGLIQNSSFAQKKMMNITMMRELEFKKEIKNIFEILNYLYTHGYQINLLGSIYDQISGNFIDKQIEDPCDIKKYVIQNIDIDYFKLIISKDNKSLCVRLGLNDIYKIGRALNIESNLCEKNLGDNYYKEHELKGMFSQNKICGVDFEGNLFLDSYSIYTRKPIIGNIFEKKEKTIEQNEYNPIFIELSQYGLTRIIKELIYLFPELKTFEFIRYHDIVHKIFSLSNGYNILYILCLQKQLKDKAV